MDHLRLIAHAERPARWLRRHGLDRQVDAVRRLIEWRLGDFTVEIDGLQMTGATVGHRGHVDSIRRGSKEQLMSELFGSSPREGGTVVDIGGYLGHFTLLAARAVGPTGQVYAFEPNPRMCDLLVKNVRLNGFEDRVVVEQAAVAEWGGRACALHRRRRREHQQPGGPRQLLARGSHASDDT